jgi:hypothetical protein
MRGDRAGEDLMTRREVAFLFRATSQAVAAWARRGRLTEVRDAEGKPRYRRAEVEELFQGVSSRGEPPGTDPGPAGEPPRRPDARRRSRLGLGPGTVFSRRIRSLSSSWCACAARRVDFA